VLLVEVAKIIRKKRKKKKKKKKKKVKPNWQALKDLLGFTSIRKKEILITPFLEYLIEASKKPRCSLTLFALDEMNLARF